MNKEEMCKHLWSNEIIGRECTISAEDIPTVAKAIMRTIPMKPLVFMYEPLCTVVARFVEVIFALLVQHRETTSINNIVICVDRKLIGRIWLMKILRAGIIDKKVKRFICPSCGCEFEADSSEYEMCSQIAYIHDGISVQCRCPCCKQMVFCSDF